MTNTHSLHFLSTVTNTHCTLFVYCDTLILCTFCPQWQTHTLCTFCLQWQTHTLHFLSTVTNAHSLHAFGLEHLLTEKHSASFVCSDKLTLSTVCLQWQTNSALFVYPVCLQWQTNSQHCLFAVTNKLCTVCLPWKIHCALFVCQVLQSPVQGCSTWYSSKHTLDLSALFMCKAHRPWKRHSKWCRAKHMLSALSACQVASVVKVCSWCRRDKDTSLLLG